MSRLPHEKNVDPAHDHLSSRSYQVPLRATLPYEGDFVSARGRGLVA